MKELRHNGELIGKVHEFESKHDTSNVTDFYCQNQNNCIDQCEDCRKYYPTLYPKQVKIVIPEVVPMLNGKDGLIREHWGAAKKRKNRYWAYIRSQTSERFTGRVSIDFTRYGTREPDWDNLCASFKHLGDSLVDAKVITDDKPSVIAEFRPHFVKCKQKEQRTEIIIKKV